MEFIDEMHFYSVNAPFLIEKQYYSVNKHTPWLAVAIKIKRFVKEKPLNAFTERFIYYW